AIKWPLPVLSATRIGWLPKVQSDLFVFQAPSHLSGEHLDAIENLIKNRQPIALAGRFSDGIDPALQAKAGVEGGQPSRESIRLCDATADPIVRNFRLETLRQPPAHFAQNVTEHFQSFCQQTYAGATAQMAMQVVYSEGGSPSLALFGSRVAAWNPPDL